MDKVLRGQPIEIWGNGSVVRDYIWIEDFTQAIATLIGKDEAWGKTFNIGSGQGHSVREVLAMIGLLTGERVEVVYHESRAVDVQRCVLDISRLQAVIDFHPLGFREALERYLDGVLKK